MLDGLVSLLSDPGIEAHPDLALASLKAFKILSRKKVNRLAMNGDGRNGGAIRAVLPFLPAAATSHDLRGKIHEEQAPTLLCTMARLLVEDAFGLLERLGIQVPGCGDAPVSRQLTVAIFLAFISFMKQAQIVSVNET